MTKRDAYLGNGPRNVLRLKSIDLIVLSAERIEGREPDNPKPARFLQMVVKNQLASKHMQFVQLLPPKNLRR